MKTLEKGQDKIKKICDILRKDTLEPAQQEAISIVEVAQRRAEEIVKEGEQQAKKLIENARTAIEHERNVFHSSLTQSSKQTIEALKQDVESKLFNDELAQAIEKETSDPKLIAKLIDNLVEAIKREGTATDLAVVIPKTVSANEISKFLAKETLASLQKAPMEIGPFTGGVQIRLKDKQLTLDITDQVLTDFIKGYIRKDFRKLVFQKQ